MSAVTEAPSGWRVEQAMSAWQSARARLLADDPDLAHDEAALAAMLGPEEGDVRDVLSRLLTAAQRADVMAEGAKQMMDDLTARRDRFRRRSEAMRGTIFAIIDAIGERKMEFPHGTISLASGRPVLVITDEDAVPEFYTTVVENRTIDKRALLAALKDGEVIEGATLSNSLPTLTIRSK